MTTDPSSLTQRQRSQSQQDAPTDVSHSQSTGGTPQQSYADIMRAKAPVASISTQSTHAERKQQSVPTPNDINLKVLTLNLENFGYHDALLSEAEQAAKIEKDMTKITEISRLIGRHDSDVMVFQEIADYAGNNGDVLHRFDKIMTDSGYKQVGRRDDTQHHNTLVFYKKDKFTLKEKIIDIQVKEVCNTKHGKPIKPHPRYKAEYVQNPLFVEYPNRYVGISIDMGGHGEVFVLGVHLKSGGEDLDAMKRENAISCINALVGEWRTGRIAARQLGVVLAGDFNTDYEIPEYLLSAALPHMDYQHEGSDWIYTDQEFYNHKWVSPAPLTTNHYAVVSTIKIPMTSAAQQQMYGDHYGINNGYDYDADISQLQQYIYYDYQGIQLQLIVCWILLFVLMTLVAVTCNVCGCLAGYCISKTQENEIEKTREIV